MEFGLNETELKVEIVVPRITDPSRPILVREDSPEGR